MTIEICVDSYEQAAIAEKYGAKRIELCSALEVGGLTPSPGMAQMCSSLPKIEVHAMIRPRGGKFVYTAKELDIICLDIESLSELGIKGVVFGVLSEDYNIDIHTNSRLLQIARSKGLEATFHRAFDLVRDPLDSLNLVIDMGFDRILTSGQQSRAIDGINLIKQLAIMANKRIEIMAGSGIDRTNVLAFQNIGIDAVHFTARKRVDNSVALGMGDSFEVDEEKVGSVMELLK